MGTYLIYFLHRMLLGGTVSTMDLLVHISSPHTVLFLYDRLGGGSRLDIGTDLRMSRLIGWILVAKCGIIGGDMWHAGGLVTFGISSFTFFVTWNQSDNIQYFFLCFAKNISVTFVRETTVCHDQWS